MASPAVPDPTMLAPVERLARFMAGGEDDPLAFFMPRGVTIFDNRSPFVFAGADAVARWAARFFEAHPGYVELRHEFGPAQDFENLGDQAYFSLPTTWTWRRAGRSFHETGGWAFVLRRHVGAWRIESHGWAVTSFTVLGADSN